MSTKEGKRRKKKKRTTVEQTGGGGARKRKKKGDLKPDTQELRPLASNFLDGKPASLRDVEGFQSQLSLTLHELSP